MKKILETKEIYKNWITLRTEKVDLGNCEYTYDIIDMKDAICVLAFLDSQTVVLVDVYRQAVKDRILEPVAGSIEENETSEQAAQRELREEIGYSAGKLEYLGFLLPTACISNHKIYFYVAEDLKKDSIKQDRTEDIEIRTYNYKELVKKIKVNRFNSILLHTAVSMNEMKKN